MFSLITRTALFASLFFAALPIYANPWASRTGRYVGFLVDNSMKVSVWDLREGKEIARLYNLEDQSQSAPFSACGISEDSMLVATGSTDGLSMWDLSSGELLWKDWTVKDHKWTSQLAFFPDGEQIATVTDGKLCVRQSRTGEGRTVIDEESTDRNFDNTIGLSSDGRRIYTNLHVGGVRCWNTVDRTVIGDFRFSNDQHFHRTGQFAVGDEYLVERCRDRDGHHLIVWDVERFTEVRRIKINECIQRPLLIEDENALIVPTRNDYSNVRIVEYDLHTGKPKSAPCIIGGDAIGASESCAMIAVPGTRYVCWDGSELVFLAERPLSTERPYSVTFQTFSDRRQSAAILYGGKKGVITGKPKGVIVPNVSSTVNLPKDIGNIRRNERWPYPEVAPQSVTQDPAGLKQVLAKLLEPLPGRVLKNNDRSKPRLFVLAIGINDYAQNEYNFQYAANDAKAFAQSIQTEGATLFGDVQVKVYVNKQASPDAFREGVAWLKRSSTPSDIAFLYFVGHALKAKKGPYFLTYTGDEEDINNTCISLSTITESLAETKAAEILLLADCVQSRAISKERTLNQEEFAKAIGSSEKLTVLASIAEEDPSAKVNQDIQHRAFTRALLEGLGGQADNDKNGEITWAELASYAPKRVSEMTENKQIPAIFKSSSKVAGLRLSVVPKTRVP